MAGFAITALAVAVTSLAPAPPASDTIPAVSGQEAVLVMDFEVKDQGVNRSDDAEVASVALRATRLFREQVERDARFTLVERDAADGSGGGSSHATACRTESCRRDVARRAGATQVIRGRYVKVSNLIRYLAVELVDPSTGRVVRSATAEVKGQRDVILPRAVAALYESLHPPAAAASADAAGG
mgnify:CR=1 FL=1